MKAMLASNPLDPARVKRWIQHLISKLVGIAWAAVSFAKNKIFRLCPSPLPAMLAQRLRKMFGQRDARGAAIRLGCYQTASPQIVVNGKSAVIQVDVLPLQGKCFANPQCC